MNSNHDGQITDLGGGVDGELQLAFLAVVDREAFHEQGREAGAGAAAETVEHEEALEARALVAQLAHAVQHDVHDLLADGVVAAGVVVGGILLTGDQLFGVEQLSVRAGPHLVWKPCARCLQDHTTMHHSRATMYQLFIFCT